MAQSPILHVTLSEEALEFVRRKVASGEYASESEVVSEGITILREQEQELARWEQEIVGPAYDRYKADPSSGISMEEVERDLEERRRLRAKAI